MISKIFSKLLLLSCIVNYYSNLHSGLAELKSINKKLLYLVSGRSKVQSFFTPEVNPSYLFSQISKQERKKIELAAFYLTCPNVIDALSNLSKNGIEIDIVIDNISNKYKQEDLESLVKLGATCRVYKPREKELMHNKFIIFHNCFNNKKLLWTGSANFTYGATKNKENIIIIKNKRLVNNYSIEFSKLKKHSLEITL